MIFEIAQIDVKPGSEAKFEQGVATAAPLFQQAKGCKGMKLTRSIEQPQRYRLMIQWATLENHTVDFRGSDAFQKWRALVSPYFAGAPQVEHVTETLKPF